MFPHMGDGGLALGAALLAARDQGSSVDVVADDMGWGHVVDGRGDSGAARQAACSIFALRAHCDRRRRSDLSGRGRALVSGSHEYGPRALGHRSVLARPDCPELRDRLNLALKRRVWYQPFCPSILESDARMVPADWKGMPNRHMTTAYMVRDPYRAALAGVVNIDGSCRPQIVRDDGDGQFTALLRELRTRLGLGALLNTSLNIHGEPLVSAPAEALQVFESSGANVLAIGPFLIHRLEPSHSSVMRARCTLQ